VLERLVIVDYQEGAGGEFMASFVSAHWGHSLSTDPQSRGDTVQKWLNTQSLVRPQWNAKFEQHLQEFVDLCAVQSIGDIAVPYHLYKWPHQVNTIKSVCPYVRFVKINADKYLAEIAADFQRKVTDRILTMSDFGEVSLFLRDQTHQHKIHCLELFKQQQLTLKHMRPDLVFDPGAKTLPSQDIEIDYGDFFVNFHRTEPAYHELCRRLDLEPQPKLLQQLIERNQKNLQSQQQYLSTL
jgi:hypothetical protein